MVHQSYKSYPLVNRYKAQLIFFNDLKLINNKIYFILVKEVVSNIVIFRENFTGSIYISLNYPTFLIQLIFMKYK